MLCYVSKLSADSIYTSVKIREGLWSRQLKHLEIVREITGMIDRKVSGHWRSATGHERWFHHPKFSTFLLSRRINVTVLPAFTRDVGLDVNHEILDHPCEQNLWGYWSESRRKLMLKWERSGHDKPLKDKGIFYTCSFKFFQQGKGSNLSVWLTHTRFWPSSLPVVWEIKKASGNKPPWAEMDE